MNYQFKPEDEFKIINPIRLKCYCNDNELCIRNNRTCETENGFCYQKIIFQIKNQRTIRKLINGCSTSKQIEFYYCNRSSMKTNFICCNHDLCNKLPISSFKLNLKQNLYFLIFFLLFLILIALIIFLIKKYLKRRKQRKELEKQEIDKHRKLTRLRDQIHYECPIKLDKFKKSWKGSRLGEKLFVKIFDEKVKQNWLNEIEIYSLLLIRHENIVDFVGKDNLLIATIYYDLGSLSDYLFRNRNLNENQMLKLMISAAKGLNHLHQDLEFKPSIAHRNLSSDNFIVCDFPELKCKLTNFSNALTYTRFEELEREYKLKQLKSIVCELEYCPPEFFNQTINYKNFISFQNADIYSFSLILCQLANHLDQTETNLETDQPTNSENLIENFNNKTKLDSESIKSNQTELTNQISEYYLKPFEEYIDNDKSKYDQMKELLKDDTFFTRPTIYYDETKVKTFNGYIITRLIKESWSTNSYSRLTIARILKDLIDLYNSHLKNVIQN